MEEQVPTRMRALRKGADKKLRACSESISGFKWNF